MHGCMETIYDNMEQKLHNCATHARTKRNLKMYPA